MSGGGGGIIIIRSRLRTTASDAVVQDNLDTIRKSKVNAILAKPDGNWTDYETHYVSNSIMIAYDNLCP